MSEAYLILKNGAVFKGKSFGYEGEAVGEIVFNTGMTGYLETLTDPSYFGQIVIQTFPLIGNYGVIPADFESSGVNVKAYVVREWCKEPSNFRNGGDLDSFLRENKIPGIYDIDTRALTRIVRQYGVMNACISKSSTLTPQQMEALNSFQATGGVDALSTKAEESLKSDSSKYSVVLWDFGAKANIARELVNRGCDVTIMPSTSTVEEILSKKPDGIMLSNGPGDPQENVRIINELRKLGQYKIPTFGICLGHQLLALANGASTTKLLYGHRGANHPVLHIDDNRIFVTSQNHGYAVVSDTLPDYARVSFINCNDGSCEGIDYTNSPTFSVQFHPEAAAGPLDSNWLFDKFIAMLEEVSRCR